MDFAPPCPSHRRNKKVSLVPSDSRFCPRCIYDIIAISRSRLIDTVSFVRINSTLRLCWIRSHVVSSGGPRASADHWVGVRSRLFGVSLQPLQHARFLSVV
ncbi:hypothetical protein EVAR_98587_1 [Eumeta japonica]|uniref:Uncharacterized protein n=1 Tax=Eumeta variegata TaxID=151549 RepID=A0A4C1T6Q9_EUMVA|nr:hypothetical protein EVAR_98587_1 [Eumeta japonica]